MAKPVSESHQTDISVPSPVVSQPKSIVPFERDHAERVAELLQQYFPFNRKISTSYLAKLLVSHHLRQELIKDYTPSLVCLAEDDSVCGFLAVDNRMYNFKDGEIRVAHASKFVLTREVRLSLTAFRILREFIDGPQDLSITDDANESSRLLWERLGGVMVPEHSIYYKLPLRPVSFAVNTVVKEEWEFSKAVAKTVGLGLDYLGMRARLPFFVKQNPRLEFAELTDELLLQGYRGVCSKYDLYPKFDLNDLTPRLNLTKQEVQFGKLQRVALLNDEQKLVGWFIYYLNRGDNCEVLEAQSQRGYENDLFHALTWHAYHRGGVQLSGRLCAVQFGTFFALRTFSLPGHMWTMMHAKDGELFEEIRAGRSFFPRI
jgi:hypothetical protein